MHTALGLPIPLYQWGSRFESAEWLCTFEQSLPFMEWYQQNLGNVHSLKTKVKHTLRAMV